MALLPCGLPLTILATLALLPLMPGQLSSREGQRRATSEPPQVLPGDLQVSDTSIRLKWNCSLSEFCRAWKITVQCQLLSGLKGSCDRSAGRKQGNRKRRPSLVCTHLQPFSIYRVLVTGTHKGDVHILHAENITTKEAVPDKPEIQSLELVSNAIRWKPVSSCKGEILGYQVNVTGTRVYNASFLEKEELLVNSSVTEYQPTSWRHGTNYTVTVQGVTAAGPGDPLDWEVQMGISEPFIPPSISALRIYNISAWAGTAVLPLAPLQDVHGPIEEYQIFITALENANSSGSCHALELHQLNSSLMPDDVHVAAVLPAHSLTQPRDFVIGDGTVQHGYYNAPLRPGRNYTALLRIVSRWKQEEKRSCVHYDFSLGELHADSSEGVVMPLVAAAGLLLLVLLGVLLWLVAARKKRSRRKEHRSNGAALLQRNRGGASKLHTQIPVADLLAVLKRFKRAELEGAAAPDGPAAGWDVEYQKLVSGLLHPCLAGKEPHNQAKNRYNSILPYDGSRVVLQSADPTADYINASHIDTYKSSSFFIAAQGPLPGTVLDFWRMIWQEKVSVIVMLTDLVEQKKPKCEQYWPAEEEKQQPYGDLTVTLSSTQTIPGLVTRTFILRQAGCLLPRLVKQFHYGLWPDHGVPRDPARLLRLVETVNTQVSDASAGPPVLVHCSAGIGRTGTFIALDFLLKMARSEGHVDVFHCVQRLREQRVSMVQTKGQYTFLYEVLQEGLLCGNTGVPLESAARHACRLKELAGQAQSDGYTQEFQALERLSELFRLSPRGEAHKPCNQPKNRSPEILPADCSRPILVSALNSDGTPGYINATFVDAYAKEERFIATQLPLQETLLDFWTLLWDYSCTSLVLLNCTQELDQTCPEFWPRSGQATYGDFRVGLATEEPRAGFTRRTLTVSNCQQPQAPALEVRFWQVDDWRMEQELPLCPATLLTLLEEVETEEQRCLDSHILVTCRDGVSRSGLFCAAGFLREQMRVEGLLDVSEAVRMLKRRQPQFVRSVEQYKWCYDLALCYLDPLQA